MTFRGSFRSRGAFLWLLLEQDVSHALHREREAPVPRVL